MTLVTESVPETLWIPYDTLAKGNIEEPFRPATQRLCRNPLSAGGDLGTRVEKRRPVAIALERRRLPAYVFQLLGRTIVSTTPLSGGLASTFF